MDTGKQMNAVGRSQLLRILHGHRDAITDSWYQAIAQVSHTPLAATEMRQHLVELTEQIIILLVTDPFEYNKAWAIGAALARLCHVQPEALGQTQEVLARQLVQDLPADQAVALQPNLAALLGAVATGFFQQAREIILAEQEQARSALIAERKQAEESLWDYAERLKILHEIDSAILSAHSAEEIAQAALRHIRQLVPCQRSSVVLFDPETSESTLLAAHGCGQNGWGEGNRFPLVTDWVDELCQGEIYAVEDFLNFSQLTPITQARQSDGLRSCACVPLVSQGELIGSLNLWRKDPGPFAPKHLDIVREVAASLAIVIRDTRLYEAVQRELTERKRAEKSLRESEERLRAQYKGIPIPTYTWQRVGESLVLVDYNDAAIAITQGKIADFVGMKAREMYQDAPEILQDLLRCFAEKTFVEREMVYRFQSTGASKHLAVKYAFVPPDLILVHTEDITERKRAEEALRESREERRELEYIVNHSPAVAFLWRNAKGWPVEFVSDNVRQFGYDPKDFYSGRMPFTSIVHPDDLERVAAEVTRYSQEGCGEFTQEYRIITKTGDVRWLDDRTWIRRDLDGVITHYQGIVLDITEYKRAEQQAAQAERLVAIGRLAAAMAHEINNPLQAIQTNLELVLDFDLEPDENAKYLHVVRQEIERLTGITRRVLDFARPADDTRYPVSAAHLIQETLKLVGKQLELAHIYVTTDLSTNLPPVFCVPDQIIQVLLNLSVNAVGAMPNGGHLHIAAHADGDMVEIALTNDGPPLPAEHIERVFDLFFTTKPGSTGMGLSISHSIIYRHGGTISVENLKDDQGVTFTITLPTACLNRVVIV